MNGRPYSFVGCVQKVLLLKYELCMQATKHVSKGIHAGFKTQDKRQQKTK